jgi:hypothetical protein
MGKQIVSCASTGALVYCLFACEGLPYPFNKSGRKRALSTVSPFSEYGVDLESLTRSSEGSLRLGGLGPRSHCSSGTSGSYGHLSAGK